MPDLEDTELNRNLAEDELLSPPTVKRTITPYPDDEDYREELNHNQDDSEIPETKETFE